MAMAGMLPPKLPHLTTALKAEYPLQTVAEAEPVIMRACMHLCACVLIDVSLGDSEERYFDTM